MIASKAFAHLYVSSAFEMAVTSGKGSAEHRSYLQSVHSTTSIGSVSYWGYCDTSSYGKNIE
jgi:hypothetical protein